MTREKRVALLIFFVLLFCYGYFFPRWAEWNQNSRMDLTLAIVERGVLHIDDYYENTGDYAVYGDHIYTDKAPGTSFLGVPTYFVFRLVADTPPMRAILHRLSGSQALASTLREGGTGLLEQKVYFAAALYATTFVTVSLPSALLAALLYLFMGRLFTPTLTHPSGAPNGPLHRPAPRGRPLGAPGGFAPKSEHTLDGNGRWTGVVNLPGGFAPKSEHTLGRVILALAYGLATIVFPYSSVFYGHQIAAALLFFAFYLLYRIRQCEISHHWLWGVGGLLGLAVLTEFPALILLVILSLYALWFLERKWEIAKLGLGGLPFALILGWYNASAFGSPFSSSYRYLGRFPEISNTGFLGFSRPSLEALWGVTFSPYRGLFFLSPFLLLAIPGFWYLLRSPRWRGEAVLWLSLVLAQLALVSAWYDWRGGYAIGPRNLLTILPFLMLPVAFCVWTWREKPLWRMLTWGLVVSSFGLVWIASVSGQEFAPVIIGNPLVDFFWPKFWAGDITRNLGMMVGLSSWYSLFPLILVPGGVFWIVRREGRGLQPRS